MTKANVAILIVLVDLLIAFYIWFALLFVRPLSIATQKDVSGDTLAPNEFTVVIEHVMHKDPVDDLIPIYWAWVENILEQDRSELLKDPATDIIDPYQNMVFNVNLGLSNTGYLEIQEEMGKLLIKKKRINKQMELKGFLSNKKKKDLTKGQKKEYDKLSKEIKDLQIEARNKMKELKKYKSERAVTAASVYIQF